MHTAVRYALPYQEGDFLFGMLIGQESTRKHVCFGECGQEKGKNRVTFMPFSKASFFCEISQAFDIFATEKNQGILPEEIIWQW